MSLRKGKWSSYPNDEQIRKVANEEYWRFICPECGAGASGTISGHEWKYREARSKGNYQYPFINHVYCVMCGWEWYDPIYYIPIIKQTKIVEFYE